MIFLIKAAYETARFSSASAALILLFGWASPGSAASPPTGESTTLTTQEETTLVLKAEDFGFSDPNDQPPDAFHRVKITTLPAKGTLTVDGNPVEQGEYLAFFPDAREIWTTRGFTGNWIDIASSADGSKLAAVEFGGQIHLSTDSGATWTPTATIRQWRSICSSADGERLAAVSYEDQIHISSDGGITWTVHGRKDIWNTIAGSSDGLRLIAASSAFGRLAFSDDGGLTWTERGEPREWRWVVLSADGTTLMASSTEEPLALSRDFGLTWTSKERMFGSWVPFCASADGSRLLASLNGKMFTSRDSGRSWSEGEDAPFYYIVCSADGMRLAAIGHDSIIKTSTDGGMSWTARDSWRQWSGITCSADGLKLVACEIYAGIHTSEAAVPVMKYTPPVNGSGEAYDSFQFQVEDDGPDESTLDPDPKTLTLNVTGVNDPPKLVAGVSDVSATDLKPLTYQIPATTFSDPDPGTVLAYTARLENGDSLPVWLSFNPADRTFSGTPGHQDTGALPVRITVSDGINPPLTASDSFWIVVSNVDDPPLGTDRTLALDAETDRRFTVADFGFSDPLDLIPNHFTGLRVTNLPARGFLTVNGAPVKADDFVELGADLPGLRWTAREGARFCNAIASSADGNSLFATVDGGQILTSSDGGATWSARGRIGPWQDLTCTPDGKRLAAVARRVGIFLSPDAGVTWTQRGQALEWQSIASSADGSLLAAAALNGKLYISSDYGVTWTARESSRQWCSVCSSADGQKLAAVVRDGRIYTSADAGLTWTARADTQQWRAICCSADGSKLAAIVSPGRIYTSDNSGITWSPRDESRDWYDITSSSDGTRLSAVVQNGQIFHSDNTGASWRARGSVRYCWAIACSADGTRLAAALRVGRIHTSVPGVIPNFSYTPDLGGDGSAYSSFFTFQVQDDGKDGLNRDLQDKTMTLNVGAVPDPITPFGVWARQNHLSTNPAANAGLNLLSFAFGLQPGFTAGPASELTLENGTVVSRGPARLLLSDVPAGGMDFAVLFGRRKDSELSFQVQFSTDLQIWEASAAIPAVLGADGEIEACRLAFPKKLSGGEKPRFFRMAVTSP